jgi:hypothetical protein
MHTKILGRLSVVLYKQGDQIGRIFAHWMIVNLGHLLKITKVAKFLGYFTYTQ